MDDWKFIFDIFLHNRLYAARYKDLNDPMEGYYTFASGRAVSLAYSQQLRSEKDEWRLCSLSAEHRSTLMWSYYGGGHSGIAVGVTLPSTIRGSQIKEVTYDNTVSLNRKKISPRAAAVKVLSQKLYSWRHEKEYRVFSRRQFIEVRINEILLGCRIAKDDEALIRKLVEGIKPRIDVRKLRRAELISDYG